MGNEVSGEISREELDDIRRKQKKLEEQNIQIKQQLEKERRKKSSSTTNVTNSPSSTTNVTNSPSSTTNVTNSPSRQSSSSSVTTKKQSNQNKLPKNFAMPKQTQQVQVTLNNAKVQLDPYTIFGLEPDCTIDDIKTVYKLLVIKYHPDKSGYDSSSEFRALQKAYALLLSIKDEEAKITGLTTQTIESKKEERRQVDEHVNRVNYNFEPNSGERFDNRRFNDMFEKTRYVDEEEGNDGYADWLKESNGEQQPTIASYTKEGFNSTFEQYAKKHSSGKQITKFIEPESNFSYNGSFDTLGESLQDYGSDGKYTDLKKAYSQANILHPGEIKPREQYTSIGQLKAARDAPVVLDNDELEFLKVKEQLEMEAEQLRVNKLRDKNKRIDEFYTRVHGKALELPTYKRT
jgi:curved DNA-binding protein CbpA